MRFRITTDHTVEATSVEDAVRQFATMMMTAARNVSEAPQKNLHLKAEDGELSVTPV